MLWQVPPVMVHHLVNYRRMHMLVSRATRTKGVDQASKENNAACRWGGVVLSTPNAMERMAVAADCRAQARPPVQLRAMNDRSPLGHRIPVRPEVPMK